MKSRKRRARSAVVVTVSSVATAVAITSVLAQAPDASVPAERLAAHQRIWRDDEGVCRWLPAVHGMRCPRHAHCNPSPPWIVECPAELTAPGRIDAEAPSVCRIRMPPAQATRVPCPEVVRLRRDGPPFVPIPY